jgi:tRNA (Thr-GGU) A37 N-methylase
VVRLVRVEGAVLHVENVDMLDGTPLLDIKPYVPDFDKPGEIRTGWLEKARRRAKRVRSDDRFAPDE